MCRTYVHSDMEINIFSCKPRQITNSRDFQGFSDRGKSRRLTHQEEEGISSWNPPLPLGRAVLPGILPEHVNFLISHCTLVIKFKNKCFTEFVQQLCKKFSFITY